MIRKIGTNGQITIPKKFIKELGLRKDDLIDLRIEGNKIIGELKVAIPKDGTHDLLRSP